VGSNSLRIAKMVRIITERFIPLAGQKQFHVHNKVNIFSVRCFSKDRHKINSCVLYILYYNILSAQTVACHE